jgi:ABC-2 type transport system permease protein
VLAAAVTFGMSGLALLYAVWCAAVTFGFWFLCGPLDTVLHWFLDTGRYPVSFFKGWVRLFFTFILPIAFASTFPAQALRGDVDVAMLLVGVVLACLALLGSSRFWNYGVRHYSSASS